MPVVHSLLKANCFEVGLDIGKGGSLYTATINYETTGQVNLVNSLASLKKNVFDDKKYSLEEMTDAMIHNFGYKTAWETQVFSLDTKVATAETAKYAKIYADCVNAPKYGNDDDYADNIYVDFQDYFPKMVHELATFLQIPEATKLICQVDNAVFNSYLPEEIFFHRDGQNRRIADGCNECHFVWEYKKKL